MKLFTSFLLLLFSLFFTKNIYAEDSILVAKESTWKYLDDGSNQGTAWQTSDFDASSWSEGQGKLGYGDDNNNTTLSYGSDSDNKYITYYFRKTFSLSVDANSFNFIANVVRDDGVVVYVNGTEAFRDGMPDGDISYTTLADGDVSRDEETSYYSFSVSSDLLVTGDNIIAVELHQTDITSSDIGFDLELTCEAKTKIETDLTVKKAVNGIAIDGELNEAVWDINTAISINDDNSDNTASFGLLWDDVYLYVGVAVADANLCNNHRQAFYDDGIEICIDGENEKTVNFDDNDLQLAKAIKSFWIQEMNDNYDNVLHKYSETTSGYTMEFAIPWSILGVSPSSGNQLGFEIVINDDEDADDWYNDPSQLIWKSDDSYYEGPQEWGTIELSSDEANYSGSYVALISPNDGQFLINGKTTNIEWFSYGVDNVTIEFSTDNGISWNTIVESTDASTSSYDWTVDGSVTESCLVRIADVSDNSISDTSSAPNIISKALTTSEGLIPSYWQNYTWPYNAYYPESSSGINGHLGNSCGQSSIARILHSWEFPRIGNDDLSFTDNGGTLWEADFGNTTYNYDNMPNSLSEDASEDEYADVATLVFHSAVSMEDIGGSGTDLDNMSYAFSHYFNFKESTPVNMTDYSEAEWTQLLINEIDSGRSLLVQGMNRTFYNDWHTSNSIGGHWYHCDGYNEDGEFHIIVGFGNYSHDGYFSIEEFPLYGYNIGVLIGLEPDFGEKSLSITQPKGSEIYVCGDSVNITWESSNIDQLQIEYTLDNGENWTEIASSVNASSGSYAWECPLTESYECRIRLTDISNINIYDKSDDIFSLRSSANTVSSPSGGEAYVFNDIAVVEWEVATAEKIDISYSTDNGTTWSEIVSGYSVSQEFYEWEVPEIETGSALLKIVDSDNNNSFGISEAFKIVVENNVGGPYTNDENTMLLLHGEGNLYNQSAFSDDAVAEKGAISFSENSISDLGKAIYIDYGNDGAYLSVLHNDSLSLGNDWTIELWFMPTAYNDGLQYLIWKPGDDDSYYSNYSMLLNGYSEEVIWSFFFSGDTRNNIYSDFTPSLDNWYHATYIRDEKSSTLSLIIRNSSREIVLEKSITSGDTPSTNIQDLLIGYNFTGYIDEVRISNVARDNNSTSVVNITNEDEYCVFPNPTNGNLQFKIPQESTVYIFSTIGQIVYYKESVQTNEIIDITNLKPGAYFVTVKTSNGDLINKKVIRY